MKKKVALLLVTVLATASLSACGTKETTNETPQTEVTTEETNETSQATTKSITVAASATPHSEILEAVKPILEEQGWKLEVTVFDDYVQPNLVVDSGDFDANYFQHQPYLDDFNSKNGTKLVSIASIHYEPLGIYPGNETDLTAISDGATIAVPNDGTNEARALMLLEANGLIKLKADAGFSATVKDIAENPHNLEIVELEAAQIARVKDEMAFVVLNGNYALQVGLNVATDAVAYEEASSDSAQTYANILVVKEGNEGNEGIQALLAVLQSEEIANFINEKYNGSVIALK